MNKKNDNSVNNKQQSLITKNEQMIAELLGRIHGSQSDEKVQGLFAACVKAFGLDKPDVGSLEAKELDHSIDQAFFDAKNERAGLVIEQKILTAESLTKEMEQLYQKLASALEAFLLHCEQASGKKKKDELRKWSRTAYRKYGLPVYPIIDGKQVNHCEDLFIPDRPIDCDHPEIKRFALKLLTEKAPSRELLSFLNIGFYNMEIDGFMDVLHCLGRIEQHPALVSLKMSNDLKDAQGEAGSKGTAIAKIFDFALIEERIKNIDPSRRSRQRENLQLIIGKESPSRELAQVSQQKQEAVNALKARFPNFSSTVEYFMEQIALGLITDGKSFRTHPVLLSGPPGIGKTAFVQALAEVIGTGHEVVDMSTMTSGFQLSGNSYKWEEGSNGVVLGKLRDGDHANPFILLDELDKVGSDNRYDPYGPLHSLLEQESSRKFIDESVGVPMDASHIVWVATANDLNRIPEPILSRFCVVDTKQATGPDAHKVIHSVWKSLRDSEAWGDAFSEKLNHDVVRFLEAESPRDVKRLLRESCGRVALNRGVEGNEKLEITAFDLPNFKSDEPASMRLN